MISCIGGQKQLFQHRLFQRRFKLRRLVSNFAIPNTKQLRQVTKKRKLWLGVDPDVNGAVAVVHVDSQQKLSSFKIDFIDMPYIDFVRNKQQKGNGKKIEGSLLSQKVLAVVQDAGINPQVIIEQPVGAMHLMGKIQTFRMAYNSGVCNGVLQGLGYQLLSVAPQSWKKDLDLCKKDKDASRELALEHFPQAADFLKRKKDHGRAEALLLVLWGMIQSEEILASSAQTS
eukprot:TRINITY_DN13764_c0_g1_i9.p1 TRINITY_DN13764_c0_g1~~TRINITY_DN13764_c0_g1_i9.p1  ORF type:complete len:229 (-),score=28.71 TRINITY_DN13764_c0_g1_i9:1089-1775(-)